MNIAMRPAMSNATGLRQIPSATCHGFTMVELLITVVILAVLAAIAVPSLRELIARQRVESIAKELATDLKYLRTKHIEGNQVVIRFGSNAASTCYVLFGWGPSEIWCDCARTDGLTSCGNANGRSEEFKTVLIPRARGVTVAATPDTLELTGFNGLPVYQSNTRAFQTIQAVVTGTNIGGELRVYTTTDELIVPKLCSVGGRQGAFPTCPQ